VVGEIADGDHMDVVKFKFKHHEVYELQCNDCREIIAAFHILGVQAKLQTGTNGGYVSEHPSQVPVALCEKAWFHIIAIPKDIVAKDEWPSFGRVLFTHVGIQLCSCEDGRLLCMIEWNAIVSHREVLAAHGTNMDKLEITIMGDGDDNIFAFQMQDCSLFPAALATYSGQLGADIGGSLKVFV
jgi:hypothetical protein